MYGDEFKVDDKVRVVDASHRMFDQVGVVLDVDKNVLPYDYHVSFDENNTVTTWFLGEFGLELASYKRDVKLQKLKDFLSQELSGAYESTRVWSAWSYGTMTKVDFEHIGSDAERIQNIAEAILKILE